MTSQGSLNVLQKIGFVSFACCVLMFAYRHAQAQVMDGAFIASTPPPAEAGHRAPVYDSEYAAEQRLTGAAGNTPEADARPGEYYFVKAAEAFRRKDYQFAIQMYEVAASWAYKPAEYNLAIMYARGQGVPADLPRGMAWIALAAERNEKRYVDAREAVYAEVTKEQFAQANEIWRELKKTYGDEIALRRAKARWAEVRTNMTGSHVGSGAVHLEVGMKSPGMADPSSPPTAMVLLSKGMKQDKAQGPHSVGTTAADVVGAEAVDGSHAYAELRQSDNPYDPKFQLSAFGTATVGPPTQTTAGAHDAKSDPSDPKKQDAEKHER